MGLAIASIGWIMRSKEHEIKNLYLGRQETTHIRSILPNLVSYLISFYNVSSSVASAEPLYDALITRCESVAKKCRDPHSCPRNMQADVTNAIAAARKLSRLAYKQHHVDAYECELGCEEIDKILCQAQRNHLLTI